jgi:hypothetical protein
MDPNPFATDSKIFEQRLLINDGYITLQGDSNTFIKMWVEVSTAGIHFELTSDVHLNVTAGFESWRTTGYRMVTDEQRKSIKLVASINSFSKFGTRTNILGRKQCSRDSTSIPVSGRC